MAHSETGSHELGPGDIKTQEGELPPLSVLMGTSEWGPQSKACFVPSPPQSCPAFSDCHASLPKQKDLLGSMAENGTFPAFLKVLWAPGGGSSRAYPSSPQSHLTAIIHLRAGKVSIPGPADAWLCPTTAAESLLELPVTTLLIADPGQRSHCGLSGYVILGPQARVAIGLETRVPSRQGFKV